MKQKVCGDPGKLQERKEKENKIKAMAKQSFSMLTTSEQDELVAFVIEKIFKEDS